MKDGCCDKRTHEQAMWHGTGEHFAVVIHIKSYTCARRLHVINMYTIKTEQICDRLSQCQYPDYDIIRQFCKIL